MNKYYLLGLFVFILTISYASAVDIPAPLMGWNMDNSSNASITNFYNLTINQGSLGNNLGLINNGTLINKTKVIVIANSIINTSSKGSRNFTVSLWYNRTGNSPSESQIVGINGLGNTSACDGTNGGGWNLFSNNTGIKLNKNFRPCTPNFESANATNYIVPSAWNNVVLRVTDYRAEVYINNVRVINISDSQVNMPEGIGAQPKLVLNGFSFINATYDMVYFWNDSLTNDQLTTIYNDGRGNQYPFSNTDTFQFIAPTPSDEAVISGNFNFAIRTNVMNTTNYNYTIINVYNNLGTLLTSNTSTSNITQLNFTSTIGEYLFNATMFLTNGTRYDTSTRTVYFRDGTLTLNATNTTGSYVQSFNVTVTDLNSGLVNFYSTGGGSVVINTQVPSNLSLVLMSSGYATAYRNVTVSSSSQVLTASFYPPNSIFFYFFNEVNGSVVTNVYISLDSSSNSYSASANVTGGAVISNIVANDYLATFTSSIYSTRQLYLSVPEGSSQVVNMYMVVNASAVLFNTKDLGGSAIDGVYCIAQTFVNGSLVTVQSAVSQLGKLQLALLGNKFYAFTCSRSGYSSNYFELNPVLYSSYDVPMSFVGSSGNVPTGYAYFSPQTFRANRNTDFSISFVSPYSSFVRYNYVVTYPSGSFSSNGTVASGEGFANTFNTSGTWGDNVVVYYGWTLDNGVVQNFTYTIPIIASSSNTTITDNSHGNFGFLVGDNVFLISFILLIFMGVGWLALGFFGSLAIGGVVLFIMLESTQLAVGTTNFFIASVIVMILLFVFRGRS